MAPKPRKTIELRELKDKVNYHLADRSPASTVESRRAMATLLEIMLMRANAYKGFKYLLSEYDFDRPKRDGNGYILRENYDDSRRKYY